MRTWQITKSKKWDASIMRKICINRDRFEQSFGYGVWIILTSLILLLFITSSIEIQSVTKEITYTNKFVTIYDTCYKSIFTNEQKCERSLYSDSIPEFHQVISIMFLIVDIIIIGFLIYHKQQKVKFSWCEESHSATKGM